MADAPSETTVPIKVPEPTEGAPPTLAEPASGPVAVMSGALPESAPSQADKPATDGLPEHHDAPAIPLTSVADAVTTNGAAQTSSAAVPSESGSAEPEKPATEAPKLDQDTEMKDAPEPAATEVNGTPASKSKRKSSGGASEPKGKSLKKKQSKQKLTNLDAQPGNYYFARLRSYPPWPAIVCDEEMLPQTLLKTRPVTAQQADGSYKEPYAEGGKKVADRTYPIMFLSTNEFAWIPNTDLTPLNPEDCKEVSEKGKAKSLIEAYHVAAEANDLAHFKEMLRAHDEAVQADEDAKAAKAAEKAAKADKKKRKSEVKPTSDDVEMDDLSAEPKKSSKKRKKDAESDDEEPEKPAKTPKTKIKLNAAKTPTTDKKEKAAKPKSEKKKKPAADEDATPEEKAPSPPVDPVQARKDREKEVLFLRHKLQKGFLSRDVAPQEDEMPQMATYIKKLEAYGGNLEVSIIRNTKINKVLKALVKLNTIPKDEEFHFRERSVKLLEVWNQLLGTETWDEKLGKGDDKKDNPSPTTTNGVHKEAEEKAEEKIEDHVEEPKEKVLSAEDAVEKISAEVPVDAETKDNAVEAVEKEDKHEPAPAAPVAASEAPKTDQNKTEPAAAAVLDKAPHSAEGAAEAHEVVKATE